MKTTTHEAPTSQTVFEEVGARQDSWASRALTQAKRWFEASKNKVVAGVALTVVGSLALTGCNNSVRASPAPEGQPTPSPSASENPGGPSPSKNIEPTNEAEKNNEKGPTPISAELSPKELGVAYFKKLDGWENSLSVPELADAYTDVNNPDSKAYRTRLVDETMKKYTDAVYVEGWEKDSDLKGWAEFTRVRTDGTFHNYAISKLKNKYAHEWYKTWTEVTSVDVVSEDEDQIALRVRGVDRNNATDFGEDFEVLAKKDGLPFQVTLTFDRTYDGKARLADFKNTGITKD